MSSELDRQFYNEDCITGMRARLEADSVDLIVTDPPYGIDGGKLHRHYNRDEEYVLDGYVEVPAAEYGDFSHRWMAEAARILRPGGAIYVVSGYTNLLPLLSALREAGLNEVNHIIWKFNFGVFTRRKYISSHYHILYYVKPGGRSTFHTECRYGLSEKGPDGESLNYADREDVWIINREYQPGTVKNKNHLPTALLERMILYSSSPGDLICDPFLGSFSTARAAIGLGRRATGFELSQTAFDHYEPAVRSLTPGFFLAGQREPLLKPRRREGASWTDDERTLLESRFRQLMSMGQTKAAAVEILMEEFGRGYWAITKALARNAADNTTADLFEPSNAAAAQTP